jgi:hypothetical protein
MDYYKLEAEKMQVKTPTETRELLGTVEVECGRIFLLGGNQDLRQVVSFMPGLGNGLYDVYAHSKHVPGYGDRITKVEIEFITDEELNYLERSYSDVRW